MDHVNGLEINYFVFFVWAYDYTCVKSDFYHSYMEHLKKKITESLKNEQKNGIFTAFSAIMENF